MNGRRHLRRIVRALHPREIAKHVSGTKLYREIAKAYDMVYFGSVSARDEDEYELVRGLTVSAQHQDKHYCVGTVEGYDVILLERTDHLRFPGAPGEYHRWVILQVDLDGANLPHIFLDNRHHSSAFYNVMFAKLNRFSKADANLFADHDPKFLSNFSVHTTPEDNVDMIQTLRPDITATLAHHFTTFDFELFDDRLIVYSSNKTASRQLIDHMLRAGIWLAREIEAAR